MYKIGDVVRCIVTGFKEYGIFVKIKDNYNGLIHISEISNSFVHNVSDYAEIGEEIYAKIIAHTIFVSNNQRYSQLPLFRLQLNSA